MRRAVELAGELGVPGLSRECAAYIASHPSNAYDSTALRVFARGLAAAGMRDRAAAVYCGLLQERSDAPQLCLEHDTVASTIRQAQSSQHAVRLGKPVHAD